MGAVGFGGQQPPAVCAVAECEVPVVDHCVVVGADECQVVEVGWPAVEPMDDVVGVAVAG